MGTLRAILILVVLALVTPFGMIAQLLLLLIGGRPAAGLPQLYHRFVCALLGVRITIHGKLPDARPLLIVSNHCSWLDIPVLSAVAPLSFIAKQEVAGWPVVGWLAKLQRTIFVDRTRRNHTGAVNRRMAERLAAGDVMVLFPEGTSSDGNTVLPFRSALIGAIQDSPEPGEKSAPLLVVPMAITYLRVNGMPMGRQHRPLAAWHGDKELVPHVWRLLKSGTIDVAVALASPIEVTEVGQRKSVAMEAERQVRAMALALAAGRDPFDASGVPFPAR